MSQQISISERIKIFNSNLLQDIVPYKYKAMADNPYNFYRGSCHLFYEDLSKEPSFPDSPYVWACGDLHLENFGSYKANNRFVYFDQNDFDESMLAPAAWELVRIVASIFIAFSSLNVDEKQIMKWAETYLKTYCKILNGGKSRHIEARLAKGIVKSFLERVGKRKQSELLKKNIKGKKNCYIVIDEERHLCLDKNLKNELMFHFREWISTQQTKLQKYTVVDAAFRLAGTGSLGVKRYVFLLQNKKNFLLLDMKESLLSSLDPYLHITQPVWASNAEREVTIQSRMQYATTALLATTDSREVLL